MGNANQIDIRLALVGMSQVQAGFRQLTSLIAGGLSIAGMVRIGKSAIDAADGMKKLSEQTGGAVEELSQLDYVFQSKELSAQQVSTGLKKLLGYMKDTGQQSKSMRSVLVGLSSEFAAMPDGATKATRAVEIFGERAALPMVGVLSEGPEKLQALFDKANQLGSISTQAANSADAFNDSMRDLGFASRSLALSLSAELLPNITASISGISSLLVKFREFKSSTAGETVSSIGGSALTVAATAMTARMIMTRLSASVAASMGGALVTLKDWIVYMQMLPGIILNSRLLTLVGWIGLVTTALATGVEWWKKWKAEKQAAESEANLAQVNNQLAETISRIIEERQVDNELTREHADALRAELATVMAIANVSERATGLRRVASGLIAGGQASLDPANIEPEVRKAKLDAFQAAEERSYEERRTSLERFIESKWSIIEQSYNIEIQKAKGNQNAEQTAYYNHQKALVEWEKWGMAERKKLREEEFRRNINRLNLETQKIQSVIANYQGTNLLTNSEKNRKLLPLYQDQAKSLGGQATAFAIRSQDQSLTQDERLDAESKFVELSQQRYELAQKIQAIEGDTSVVYQMKDAVKSLADEWGTVAQQIGAGFKGVINSAIGTISDNLTAVIMQTKSWNQALLSIGQTILSSIVSAIVTMFTTWIVKRLLLSTLDMAASGREAAAAVPAAVAKTGATSGVNWVIGAALMAALAAGIAASLGAFKTGGYTGNFGVQDVAGIVHGKEFVMNADATSSIGLANLEAMNATGAMPMSGGGLTLIMVDKRSDADSILETTEGRVKLLDFISSKKHLI